MAGLLDAISNAASSVATAVTDVAMDAGTKAIIEIVEKDIEKQVGHHIDITTKDIPSDWKSWIMSTGLNSLAYDRTWDFLDAGESNRRKVELWKARGIKRIEVQVWLTPDEDDDWITEEVEWEQGWDYFILWYYPSAKRWGTNSTTWLEDNGQYYWNLGDEIEFGLQLYQLPGKCFYKSDWVEGWEDVDPDGPFPWSTAKFKRWLQFRHWIMFWYREAQSGYNYRYTQTPPPLKDGSPFNLDSVLSMPSMPNLKMPAIKLPSLPNVSLPSLPDAPSLPSISAPSLSMPSLSAPSLSMPSLSAPSIPDKKKRPKSKWAAHGLIELEGLNVKASGKTLILSDAKVTQFWLESNGSIKDEQEEHKKFELTCTSEEQAKSWVETLVDVGCKEGEAGCCTIA